MTLLPMVSESKQVWIGIDPSKHSTGVAVIVDGFLEYFTTLDVWDVLSVRKFRSYLYEQGWITVNNDVLISCEVSGHSKFSNFDVNRAAGMAIAYIASVGLIIGPLADRVRFWYPQQWRKQVFGTASKEQLGAINWKRYAVTYVMASEGLVYVTDDEAEAILLARLCGKVKEQDETKVSKTRVKKQRRMVSEAA